MTSNTLMKAGFGALLAFGLAAAPLAVTPAQSDPGSAPMDPTTTAAPVPARALPAAVTAAPQSAPHVLINEVYLNGGSTGAAYKNKFVELYNPTDAPVSLGNWSLQYRSATGTVAPTGLAALAGTIAPKGYYLVQGNSNADNGLPLPPFDADAPGFSFASGGGTLILSD